MPPGNLNFVVLENGDDAGRCCWGEIFELGRRFDWESARISTLFDILIDDANLVTRVETYRDESGELRLARTFKPDGEVVGELLRRYTIQWGLPRGF